jgi:hypothetical protein
MMLEWAVREDATRSGGTRDSNYDNNVKSDTIVLCGPKATNPSCPPAGG